MDASANSLTTSAKNEYSPSASSEEELDYSDPFATEDEAAPTYMQNRELSWLTFNERVLDQGADASVPLLERLNFVSIYSSNLQEFFMVRVGSLTDLSAINPPVKDGKTGMTVKEQLRAIYDRCHQLAPIQESIFEHVRGALAQQGVRHLRPEDLAEEQRNYLMSMVRRNIEPFLSPQIINARHPFPHLENGKLYILVRLDEEEDPKKKRSKDKEKKEEKKSKGGADGVVLGLIPLPHQCDRIIKLPGRGFQFILLEHALEMFVPIIFSMYKIKHTNVICVTRNADLDSTQGLDELDDDYREHMKRLLKERSRLAPVRLECERPLSPVMEKLILKRLHLKPHQVYDTIVPLDLSYTFTLGRYLSEKKREGLTYPALNPAWPASFDRHRSIMDQVSARDALLFFPYESIDPFVQLLREAAHDPEVVAIRVTLYRLANHSHIAEAIIAAARLGKDITVLLELRARFDESNNIEWSQRFEEAGCNVIYGFRELKVHTKVCCITRRRLDGTVQHITQLGTGNYNEKTARAYTDLCYITSNDAFGRDAMEFFRNMQLENISDNYRMLYVAPLQLKDLILDGIDEQIARAKAGKSSGIFFKTNSVTDKAVINKIVEASQAGVRVTLFVRGICCLLPQVKGATENVRVVSIVGRLLEHSRIYCFGPSERCKVFLSSADLMTRNLTKRVEIAWPLVDEQLKNRLLTYIGLSMHDTAKLRELRANGTYTPLGAFRDLDLDGNPKPAFDSQQALIAQASDAAEELQNLSSRYGQATSFAGKPYGDNSPAVVPFAVNPGASASAGGVRGIPWVPQAFHGAAAAGAAGVGAGMASAAGAAGSAGVAAMSAHSSGPIVPVAAHSSGPILRPNIPSNSGPILRPNAVQPPAQTPPSALSPEAVNALIGRGAPQISGPILTPAVKPEEVVVPAAAQAEDVVVPMGVETVPRQGHGLNPLKSRLSSLRAGAGAIASNLPDSFKARFARNGDASSAGDVVIPEETVIITQEGASFESSTSFFAPQTQFIELPPEKKTFLELLEEHGALGEEGHNGKRRWVANHLRELRKESGDDEIRP